MSNNGRVPKHRRIARGKHKDTEMFAGLCPKCGSGFTERIVYRHKDVQGESEFRCHNCGNVIFYAAPQKGEATKCKR